MADVCATPGLAQEIEEFVEREREPVQPTGSNPLLASLLYKDELKAAKEKIESDDFKSKIYRFPPNLRGLGRDRDYIAPRIVAIGPYYHGVPELQAMEEVKRMAAYYFCEGLADSREEVYKKVLPVVCNVRGCYADADAFKGINDDDFAVMMFLDGCFLVQFMLSEIRSGEPSVLESVIDRKGRVNILRDIMLLENQIPWPVIQRLMDLRPVSMRDFIGRIVSSFRIKQRREIDDVTIDENFKPPHLLGLIHFYRVRSSFVKEESRLQQQYSDKIQEVKEFTLTTSAAELAEIGIKLTFSWTMKFFQMKVETGPLFGTLSLAPVSLEDDVSASVLVNMVVFEQCTGTGGNFDYPVNSYLYVLAQLMQRDDDVRELRGKGIVHTTLDYHQTLKFFNCLVPHLRPDLSYYVIFQGLEEYKQRRWVCIAIHKFLYNNFKIIFTGLTIAGLVVGIFKALLTLKQHQP